MAQLVARLPGRQKVVGSIPTGSTRAERRTGVMCPKCLRRDDDLSAARLTPPQPPHRGPWGLRSCGAHHPRQEPGGRSVSGGTPGFHPGGAGSTPAARSKPASPAPALAGPDLPRGSTGLHDEAQGHADVAQLVARHLAKVKVAGSSPVIRSSPTLRRDEGTQAHLAKQADAHGSEPCVRTDVRVRLPRWVRSGTGSARCASRTWPSGEGAWFGSRRSGVRVPPSGQMVVERTATPFGMWRSRERACFGSTRSPVRARPFRPTPHQALWRSGRARA